MGSAARVQGSLLSRVVQTFLVALLVAGIWHGLRDAAGATRKLESNPLSLPDLSAVLARGDLPQSFGCGGLTWRAAGAGRVDDEFRLVPVDLAGTGYSVFRYRGTDPAGQRLYMPVARRGPLARVYVWYVPG